MLLMLLITVSGIYAVPYTSISAETLVYAKRALYVIVMALILVWVVASRRLGAARRFSVLCGIYGAILVVNMLIRSEKYSSYVYLLVSISFIWTLVLYFNSSRRLLDFCSRSLRISMAIVAALCLALVVACFFHNQEALALAVSGLNGNRVNFSIWLSQFVFLAFFLARKDDLLYPLIVASVLIVAQILSGGRIGLLASLCLAVYFILKRARRFYGKTGSMAALLTLLLVFGIYSPTNAVAVDTSIFRDLGFVSQAVSKVDNPVDHAWAKRSLAENIYRYADRLTSHRVSILKTGAESLDMQAALYGDGLGNFEVELPERSWSVHNVFLKMLGEFGFPALLPLVGMLAIPIFGAHLKTCRDRAAQLMIFVGIGVAMVQPEYLIAGLSNCLIFWFCYAWLLSRSVDHGDGFSANERHGTFAGAVDRRTRFA
jgi:hypothetical protein